MAQRIRGQEALINITIEDEFLESFGLTGHLTGSFAKVNNFEITPRIDQTESSFIGEDFDDLDQQLHGYDFSFEIDESDTQAMDFLSLISFKEKNKLLPPVITVSATYVYREPGIKPRTEVLTGCIMKPASRSVGGRKEYIKNSFEGKAKDREVLEG